MKCLRAHLIFAVRIQSVLSESLSQFKEFHSIYEIKESLFNFVLFMFINRQHMDLCLKFNKFVRKIRMTDATMSQSFEFMWLEQKYYLHELRIYECTAK